MWSLSASQGRIYFKFFTENGEQRKVVLEQVQIGQFEMAHCFESRVLQYLWFPWLVK